MKTFILPELPPNINQWSMAQTWQNLLFANWSFPPKLIQEKLPLGLEVDTYKGVAWLSVVPFQLMFTLYPFHQFPFAVSFNELNLRTYVRYKGQSGVYFFCLDATDWLSVEVARKFFNLNYFHAHSNLAIDNNSYHYKSERVDKRGNSAKLDCQYMPTSEIFYSTPGSLEAFLTEKYCFFSSDDYGKIHRADIYHQPWQLQQAQVNINQNTMFEAHGFTQPDSEPLYLFAKHTSVVNWWLDQPSIKC